MKLQFLLAGIVATGLFASAPDAVAHGGFGGGGGGGGHGRGGFAFHGGGGGFHGGRFESFHGHRNIFFGFDFVAFGFPYWWYTDYGYADYGYADYGYPYYGYPDDYAYYDYPPVYDYRYWEDLAMRVQSELARRGYYHGQINGLIDSDSRQAIRAFQKAKGLPVTGLTDPGVLRALKLPVPQAPSHSS